MQKYNDDGTGKPGKGAPRTDAGIPMHDGGAYSYGNAAQYPQAEINYEQLDGTPADGTPLYPEAASNPAQATKLGRFRIRGFKDLWASILFFVFLLFSIVWSIVQAATYKYASNDGHTSSPIDSVDVSLGAGWLAVICIVAACASVVTSMGMLIVAQRIPVQLIWVANIITIIMLLVSAIMAFVRIDVVVGVLMLICTILQAVWLFLVRSRIPFAAALLRTSSKVISTFKLTFVLNLALSAICFGYLVLWGYGVAAPTDRFYKNTGNAGYGFAIGLLVFTGLWVSQVVPNVMHVTTSGLVATWYFAGFQNMPPNPTLASFKRATTTSFGSICFGSLIVAFIQFLRWLVESSGNDNENGFLRCLLECILRCLENIVEYFNRYAFVHVAIYGCGYIEGAKRTFALCQQCFSAAYFNDCLVTPTLNMFTFAISILFGFIAGVASHSWPVGVIVFLVAAMVHSLFFVAVDSAVTTVFVCFAEFPEALRDSDPELYAAIDAADANGTNNNAAPPI